MSLSRRLPSRSLWLACLVCAFVACSDDDDDAAPTPTEPPALDITGFVSSDGAELESFAPGQPVGEPCDGQLTVLVGPTDPAGRLANWDLRPPDTCGRIRQCGYVAVRVLDAEGREVAGGAAAAAGVPVDVTALPPGAGYSVVAELRQGRTGEIFTTQDADTGEQVEVTAQRSLTLTPRACPEGTGAGGAGGAPGAGEAGAGGLGGPGGLGGGAG